MSSGITGRMSDSEAALAATFRLHRNSASGGFLQVTEDAGEGSYCLVRCRITPVVAFFSIIHLHSICVADRFIHATKTAGLASNCGYWPCSRIQRCNHSTGHEIWTDNVSSPIGAHIDFGQIYIQGAGLSSCSRRWFNVRPHNLIQRYF